MSSLRSPCGFRSRPPRQCQVPMQSTCGFRSRISIARDPPTIRPEQNEELLSNARSIARHLPADRGERGARRRDRFSCVVSFASNGLASVGTWISRRAQSTTQIKPITHCRRKHTHIEATRRSTSFDVVVVGVVLKTGSFVGKCICSSCDEKLMCLLPPF
jgi:hypothetical protein